jgi:DNA-binding CsgD family transcriptional regulator
VTLNVFEEQVYRSTRSGHTPEQIAALWGTDVESVRAALAAAEAAVRENPDAVSGVAED